MVAKLLFRVIDSNRPVDKRAVFKELMTQLKVPLLGLKQVAVGFNAIVERQEDTDVILSAKGIELLKTLNLSVRIPPQVRAKRSLFLRRIDAFVGSHSPEEIKEELEAQNPWLKVREVFKIKDYTHVLKVECKELQMADKALEQGLLCYYTKIAGAQIERETYVSLQLCFKCYKYENHQTNECPEGNIQWCSECGAHDHNYRECRSTNKQCLNCKGPHRTMAMACPVKKQIMNDKIKRQNEKRESEKQSTYASVARTAASAAIAETQIPIQNTVTIGNDVQLRAVTSILHAHIHNMLLPGTYQTELNRLLDAHGISRDDNYPENPPSNKLFNIQLAPTITDEQRQDILAVTRDALKETQITETPHRQTEITKRSKITETAAQHTESTTTTDQTETMDTQSIPEQAKPQRTETIRRDRTDSVDLTDDETILSRQIPKISSVTYANELDARLIMRKSDYRHKDLRPDAVAKLFREGSLKFRLDYDSDLTAEQFEQLIRQKKIRETTNNIKIVNDEVYKKIRNGREVTPTTTYEQESKTGHLRTDGRR